jgi:Glucose / Sorbosone dehydrogenase
MADDLVAPVGMVIAPGDEDRTFVIEQTGVIHVFQGVERAERPFLDLSKSLVRLDREYDERGLLGLAFHPDHATNGRFFVYYSAPAPSTATAEPVDHLDRLSEFRVSGDADVADPASERVILEFGQPQPNHSGGALGFGPDGFLYLGAGDGGGRGDADEGHAPGGNAQDTTRLNGKVLRIDVDHLGDDGYGIPLDNPFVSGGGRPEIYAFGFRNPWRLAWEPTGERRLLVSDVGYGRYEEVDDVVNGGNYGWRIREGMHCLDIAQPLADVSGCPSSDAGGRTLIEPVVEYSHRDVGIAVVSGQYVFGDFSADWTTNAPDPNGSLLVAKPTPAVEGGPWSWRRLTVANDPLEHQFVTGMGEDAAGELYVMARHSFGPTGRTGFVYRIAPPVS